MRDAEDGEKDREKIGTGTGTRRVPRGRVDILPQSVQTVMMVRRIVSVGNRECETEGYRLRLHVLFWRRSSELGCRQPVAKPCPRQRPPLFPP